MAALTYERAPMNDCPELAVSLQDQSEGEVNAAPRHMLPKRGLFMVLGLVMIGTALLWVGRMGNVAELPVFAADGAIQLSEDPCKDYPNIALEGVTHTNLGGQGPDSGDEGMVYQAKDYLPGHDPMDLIITVNASSAYKVGHASYNGIHGKYGLITMKGGNEAEFTFTVLDPTTLQPKTLSKQEITFFDLDQGADEANREFIKVTGTSNVWLTKNTEVRTSEVDGLTQYISTVHGSGHDNPHDPLALTVQQKNRAVTMEFKNFHELKVTLGNTAGPHVRYFMFVMRPSLLCAATVGNFAQGDDEVVAVGDDTTTPASTEEKNCLFTIPVINYCVPKFF